MDYKEQLKSPKWQKLRLQIMQRDNFQYQLCGDKDSQLSVHHLYYREGKAIWNYPHKSLITLCENCHRKEHGKTDCGKYTVVDEMLSLKEDLCLTNEELSCLFGLIRSKMIGPNKDEFYLSKLADDNSYEQMILAKMAKRRNG